MRSLHTLGLLAITCTTSAQVSIGPADMPAAGDVIHLTSALPDPLLDLTSTGAGQAWDFSTLYAIGGSATAYQTVASTNPVYALVYADLPFNPNRANHAAPGVSIPFSNLLPIDDPYTFFHRSNSAYRVMGFGAGISGLPVPITFDQPDVIHTLPVNFGNSHVSHSSYSINIPTLAYYGYAQTRTSAVDGWGTLITPAGTFDALRVKAVITGRDTIQVDQLGLGFTIDRPTITEYTWLAQGITGPVLSITTTTLLGAEVVTSVRFHDEPRDLVITQPLPSPICAGSTFQVDYTASGAFNPTGLLLPANQFRAQLSDANGDFANPVTIGTVTAHTSGAITVTIPAGTPAGNGYRIRVIATSPAFTGSDNGTDLTIDPQPLAVATVLGTPTICAGGSVDISVPQAPATLYQWYLDGLSIPGADQSTVTATAPGAYAVSVTNACGSQVSPPVFISSAPPPSHVLSDTAFTFCPAAPFTLSAVDQSGLSPLTYQWYLDGIVLTGEVDPLLVVSTAGTYSVMVTHTVSGCSYVTDEATATETIIPTPTLTAVGATTLCPGDAVWLAASGPSAATWSWQLDGQPINGAQDSLLLADQAGTYSVVAWDTLGCGSDTSLAIMVTQLGGPAPPVISAMADSLYTDAMPGSFQWFFNGDTLAGANDPWVFATATGEYTVLFTDTAGCSSMSQPFTYLSTGLPTSGHVSPTIHPNPFAEQVVLHIPFSNGAVPWQLIDQAGREILRGVNPNTHQVLDLHSLAPGHYMLRVPMADGMHNLRLVKQ